MNESDAVICSGCGVEIEPGEIAHRVVSGRVELKYLQIGTGHYEAVAPGDEGYENDPRSVRVLCNACHKK